MTIFADICDVANEKEWGGLLPFLPEPPMIAAGAVLSVRGENNFPECYQPNVVQSGRLLTGQNPYSAPGLADALALMLQ